MVLPLAYLLRPAFGIVRKRRLALYYARVNLVRCCNCSLPIAVGSLYVRRYFKEEAREAVLEMVSDIRHEFLEILNEIDWMDEMTK